MILCRPTWLQPRLARNESLTQKPAAAAQKRRRRATARQTQDAQFHLADAPYSETSRILPAKSSDKRNFALLTKARSVHDAEMAEDTERRRRAFIQWMKANKLTYAKIQRASGVSSNTVRSFANGDAKSFKGITQEKIAAAFGLTTAALFGDSSPIARVGVFGRIGARADVFPADIDGDQPMYDAELPSGLDPGDDYVAFEIEGFSMPPAEPGWIVIFRRREIPLEELIGFPCMIELVDGRRLFKRLRRGYAADRWNLESWDGSAPIEDVEIAGALPFASLMPGRAVRK
jgi:transcriptional regulator with XRE-family HTH domain